METASINIRGEGTILGGDLNMRYDHVIVGAGSAGAILAARLTEDPDRSVLLLEAGPDYPNVEQMPEEIKYGYGQDPDIWPRAFGPDSKHSWSFLARATQKKESMLVPRGKVVGGSSAVNAQIFLRGVPDDYDSWAAIGNDKWSFNELLPYFRKLETDTDFRDEFHGSDGPIVARRFKDEDWNEDQRRFYEACRAIGYADCRDFNDPDAEGVGPAPFNNPDGIRWSTAIGYLNPSRHRLNLTIKGDCLVHRVLFEGKRAVGALVESGGEIFTVSGDEIILSGGPVGSPHILLRSGVGPSNHLDDMEVPIVHDLPGVGQNLRDHPQVPVMWKTKPDFPHDPLAPKLQVVLRYTASGSHLKSDMFVVHLSSMAEEGYLATGMPPSAFGNYPCLYLAEGAGELKLRSTDPHVQPVLDYNYFVEPFDRERMREGVRICLELGQQQAYREIVDKRIDPTDADVQSDQTLDDWMDRAALTSHHISSTCKMGPSSDSMAVVDQCGKVHGLEGIRVVDASIMPDCIRANTNVSAMVIGERVAEFVRQGC